MNAFFNLGLLILLAGLASACGGSSDQPSTDSRAPSSIAISETESDSAASNR